MLIRSTIVALAGNGCKYKIGGELDASPYQNKIMFNRSRWANNCTVTPLFYICCYGAFFIMETKQFKIEYRLTLKDGSYLETSTFVAAKDRDIALSKLKIWRETQEPKFDKIEFYGIDRVYDVVV